MYPDSDAATQPNEPTTISGKPLTFPVAFRLTSSYYQKLQDRAIEEGKSVAALLQEWVVEKLSEVPQEAREAKAE